MRSHEDSNFIIKGLEALPVRKVVRMMIDVLEAILEQKHQYGVDIRLLQSLSMSGRRQAGWQRSCSTPAKIQTHTFPPSSTHAMS